MGTFTSALPSNKRDYDEKKDEESDEEIYTEEEVLSGTVARPLLSEQEIPRDSTIWNRYVYTNKRNDDVKKNEESDSVLQQGPSKKNEEESDSVLQQGGIAATRLIQSCYKVNSKVKEKTDQETSKTVDEKIDKETKKVEVQ
ncbi:17605_t:CDS:2, partial [Racocetra fulgida]